MVKFTPFSVTFCTDRHYYETNNLDEDYGGVLVSCSTNLPVFIPRCCHVLLMTSPNANITADFRLPQVHRNFVNLSVCIS